MTVHVTYLVNQYPAVSHTFIRREINALERRGLKVHRVALRGWNAKLVDERDVKEQALTRYVLKLGAMGLAGALCREALRSPRRMFCAARLVLRMARQSDRPLVAHLAYLAEACVIRRWTAETGSDHLHAHFATNPAEVAMLARALGGPPYSFTAHGSDIMNRPAQVGLDVTVRDAAFVAAVCSFGRSQIFKWVPHKLWDRVRIVRCGLERGYGEASTAPAASSNRLLCIGRLSKEKGQLLLIEATRLLADAGDAPEVVLVGDGPMRSEVEALIARHGLVGKIRIAGWLDANGIEAELRQARALVVPSLSEGLPVVIMEAMAHRRPVIAPYVAGIPELVTHGANGWLFPASDTAALAAAMKSCLDLDADGLARMGASAHARVWQMHDVDVEARKLQRLFEDSVTRPAPPLQ
jgi:colanic acid/amylovoran biosynthesis glycosyltransferase